MTRRFITITNPLCQVAVFLRPDGSAQAAVSSGELSVAVMEIPKPPDGERIVIHRGSDGSVDVVYEVDNG